MKGIAKSKLHDWIATYEKKSFFNDEGTNGIVNKNTNKLRFIEISKDTIVDAEPTIDNRDSIKLCYKDVTL